jgi:hypothetical protein
MEFLVHSLGLDKNPTFGPNGSISLPFSIGVSKLFHKRLVDRLESGPLPVEERDYENGVSVVRFTTDPVVIGDSHETDLNRQHHFEKSFFLQVDALDKVEHVVEFERYIDSIVNLTYETIYAEVWDAYVRKGSTLTKANTVIAIGKSSSFSISWQVKDKCGHGTFKTWFRIVEENPLPFLKQTMEEVEE